MTQRITSGRSAHRIFLSAQGYVGQDVAGPRLVPDSRRRKAERRPWWQQRRGRQHEEHEHQEEDGMMARMEMSRLIMVSIVGANNALQRAGRLPVFSRESAFS